MKKNKGYATAAFLILAVFVSGCGSPQAPKAPDEIAEKKARPELPILEQNQIYLTNRPEPQIEPDYSFEAFDNGLEPIPEDALPTTNTD